MRIVLRYAIFFLSLLTCELAHAQKEANIWYFGKFLGIDFNSGVAVPLNDGQLNTIEGVATICNSNGGLLFYTDGIKIWNRVHSVMPNGAGLLGDPSSTQSAVIVQKIGDTSRYYVFTVAQLGGPNGLRYSVVNMTLDGGLGDVETKNVPLVTNVTEKVTAVRHCNNRDVWVLAHQTASDVYYSFLVNPSGINTTPVISHTGSVLPGIVAPSPFDSSTLGYMKASPNGKKIVAGHWTVNVDVSDFNNVTGVVSNSYGLYVPGDPHYLSYGVEFSPDSKLVYSTVFYTDPSNGVKRNALFQYNTTLGTPAAVIASRQIISQNSDPIQTYAALQIAPDGKMYMAKNTYKQIASIDNPNVYGSGCNFNSSAITYTLPSQTSSFGLPTFVQSYFYPADSFAYTINCPGLTANFIHNPAADAISVQWDFNDPASGINNTSILNNPSHTFNATGNYNVKLIRYTTCGSDTLMKVVHAEALSVNLGPDTTVCGGTVVLNSSAAGSTNTFLWQDGSTNPTFTATAPGLYWVQATNSLGCTGRDSINVTFRTMPSFNLGPDTALCAKDTLTLTANAPSATSFLWNTGATSNSIKIYVPGAYWCEANNGGCKFRDTMILLPTRPTPVVNLGSDLSLCTGTPVNFNATNPNSTYSWQDGSTNASYVVTTSGLYWVAVTNTSGCTARDSVNVTFRPTPSFTLGPDTSLCARDTLTLTANATATSFLWNTGATTSSLKIYLPGIYWCEADNNGCKFRDTMILLATRPAPLVNLGSDLSLCTGTPVNLNATNPNSTYSWQDGSTNATYAVTTSGLYWVAVTNTSGCTARDSINVTFRPTPSFNLGPDTSLCARDTLKLIANVTATSFLWNTGATTSSIKIYLPGIYWCEADNNGCKFRDTMILLATRPAPVVNLGNDLSLCTGTPVNLNATNPNSNYIWQDGSTNATYAVTTSGLYWVAVTNTSGCTARDSINVTFRLTPSFNLGPDTSLCARDTLTLTANATATSFLWNTGAIASSIKIYLPGIYWCEADNNGCKFRDTMNLLATRPLPVVNLGNDLSLCSGNSANLNATNPNSTYLWQDGSTNATLTATASGLYWVAVTNNSACTARDSINIIFKPTPSFNLGADTSLCARDTLTLTANATATSFLWNTGAATSSIKIFQPGIYWCEADNNGCKFRDTMNLLSIKLLPVVNLGNDTTLCEGLTVNLDATYPSSTYLWQDGSTNPTYTVSNQGTYRVVVTYNGCKKSDTVLVNYNLKPRFTLGPDQLICQGNVLILAPVLDPAWQLIWQDGSTNPTYTVTQPGSYFLSATNTCGSTSDGVLVGKGLCQVYVPNAFTPNGDGLNDVFRAVGTEAVTQFSMKIFNRYGQVVFETTDKSKGWDGKLNGQVAPGGAFVYMISYKDNNSTELKLIKGSLLLIR